MDTLVRELTINIDCEPAMFSFILAELSKSEALKSIIRKIRQDEFSYNSRNWHLLKQSTIERKERYHKQHGLRFSPETVNVRSGKLMDDMQQITVDQSGQSIIIGNMAEGDSEDQHKIERAQSLGRDVDGFTSSELEQIKNVIKQEITRIVQELQNA